MTDEEGAGAMADAEDPLSHLPENDKRHLWRDDWGQNRVGVPGGRSVQFRGKGMWRTFFSWYGSSFQAAHESPTFYFHVGVYFVLCALFTHYEYHDIKQFPTWMETVLRSAAIFMLVFYTSRVIARFETRFHDCCKTNGAVTLVITLCCSYLPKKQAVDVIRYTVAFVHVYYMLTDLENGMDRRDWQFLQESGMLTREECAYLVKRPKIGGVLYTWAAKAIHKARVDGHLDSLEAYRIEQNMGMSRGLSAKQIAYNLTPVPKVYFHMLAILVQSWLLLTGFIQAVKFADYMVTDEWGHNAFICFVGEVLIIYIFNSLWYVSVILSDPFGDHNTNYDIRFDMKNSWAEAKTIIESSYDIMPPVTLSVKSVSP